jgi:hypothetical protein
VELPRRSVVTVDMSALTEPDPLILDALVRLQLAARRFGASVRLENACPTLLDLLALAGLADVLPSGVEPSGVEPSGVEPSGVEPSGVEMDRQTEEWKEGLVDEEVDPGDAPA